MGVQPRGSPSALASAIWSSIFFRQAAASPLQSEACAASVTTAPRRASSLYSARPMDRALTLKASTRTTPTAREIPRTWRLYQPETRAIWSSYQVSSWDRKASMSSPADFSSESNGFRRKLDSGNASTPARTLDREVVPSASGTRRSMIACAKDRLEMYEGSFRRSFRVSRRSPALSMTSPPLVEGAINGCDITRLTHGQTVASSGLVMTVGVA